MRDSQVPSVASVLERSFSSEVIVFEERDLGDSYFDLSSGLLGELFQKLINYDRKAALVVLDYNRYGKRINELIYEHRDHSHIRFFSSVEEAREWVLQPTEETP